MTKLVWDRVGDRVYESGLDKGVLYLPDGSAVPWNGLTSIIESFDKESSPVYYDGMKIQDLVVLGDFSATMKAVTYPNEFTDLEGFGEVKRGLFYADQSPKTFGLCYRTKVGNDLVGEDAGYKIHVLYNVTAIPNDKNYATTSDQLSLVEFEWNITAVPEEIPGFRPTAHIILDSTEIDPWLLEELEEMLYGATIADAALIPMSELVVLIQNWFRVQIIDNEDGTWTAIEHRPGFIHVDPDRSFSIVGVNAVYLDDVTYLLSDTADISEVPQIKINDNLNGTWTATTDHAELIIEIDEKTVEIRNANVVFLNPTVYQISDTTEDD